jgi:cytidylate kinase
MPLITISASLGSGGAMIGRRVAEAMNVELYDDVKLQQSVLMLGLKPNDIEELDEKAPGFFDYILSSKPQVYLGCMESVIYEVARRGEGVIIGHGGQILLQDFDCALHVLVHASMPNRVRNLVQEKKLSPQAAEKLIHKSDHEKAGFFQFAFHLDWYDPALYDLVINPAKIGTESAAKLVLDAGGSEHLAACSVNVLETMERLSMEKKIKAALLGRQVNLAMLHIEVPEKGKAAVRGFSYSHEEKERILAALDNIPGVSDVDADIALLHHDYT